MSNDIVIINVSQTQAPTPSTLQRTGAFVSNGGTTETANSLTLVTSLADVTAILAPTKNLSSLAWSSSVVTATTSAAHGWTNGDIIKVQIAGAVPTGYNGVFLATVTGASTFTYPLTSSPGSETTPGTVQIYAALELQQMATTFFAQGGTLSCYVLELGEQTLAAAVTAFGAWLTANPLTVYSFLVPRGFGGVSGYLTLVATYEALTAKTYFFTTVTNGNYTGLLPTMKCVVGLIEAPVIAAEAAPTEFSLAADFFKTLNYQPSSTNLVTPNAFSYQFGVTPYPPAGNAALFATLKAASVNIIGTGAEGGISTAILFWGTTMDGRDFRYWYSVDWAQINVKIALANEVINGSNNPQAPLNYNQAGINRLQARAAQTMSSMISFGMALGTLVQTSLPAATFIQNVENGVYSGQVVVNAEPFVNYSAENPNDYRQGVYGGLAICFSPLNGFKQIIVGVQVTDFPNS